MKLEQGDEEHVYRMGTVYLMLTDKHGSDKCESYKALLGSHSNNKKLRNLVGLSWMVTQRNDFTMLLIITIMAATIH